MWSRAYGSGFRCRKMLVMAYDVTTGLSFCMRLVADLQPDCRWVIMFCRRLNSTVVLESLALLKCF